MCRSRCCWPRPCCRPWSCGPRTASSAPSGPRSAASATATLHEVRGPGRPAVAGPVRQAPAARGGRPGGRGHRVRLRRLHRAGSRRGGARHRRARHPTIDHHPAGAGLVSRYSPPGRRQHLRRAGRLRGQGRPDRPARPGRATRTSTSSCGSSSTCPTGGSGPTGTGRPRPDPPAVPVRGRRPAAAPGRRARRR